MGDLGRFTRDVDLAVALDCDEFERLTMRLAAIGWTPSPKLEHRWIAPPQTIIDLLPAGAELRRSGSITGPASQFRMSLAGFEHVFAHAIEVHLPGGMTIRVAPPIATTLLKIIPDIRIVLRRCVRRGTSGFEFANAFLLGVDMRAPATGDDARFVERFLGRLLAQDEEGRFDDESDFGMKSLRGQIYVFRKGFIGP